VFSELTLVDGKVAEYKAKRGFAKLLDRSSVRNKIIGAKYGSPGPSSPGPRRKFKNSDRFVEGKIFWLSTLYGARTEITETWKKLEAAFSLLHRATV